MFSHSQRGFNPAFTAAERCLTRFDGNNILDLPVLALEELYVYSFEFAVRGALQRSAM